MKNRGFLPIIIVLFFILVSASFASASFVCGTVNSSENLEVSWVKVIAYYTDQPSKTTNCRVSPENRKFCCDLLNIAGVPFGIGKNITAKISEQGGLYFSTPVTLKTTGSGYDLFGELDLKSAIKLYDLNYSVYNESNISLSGKISEPYINLRYVLKNNDNLTQGIVCNNCTNFVYEFSNLGRGFYELTLFASNGAVEVVLSKNFSIVDNLEFTRNFSCTSCSNGIVSTEEIVNFTISVNSSVFLRGKLIEYYPNTWTYIGEDEHGPYSESHNYIAWNVEGEVIQKNYTLIAPKLFLSKNYIFQSQIESIFGEEEKILVSRFRLLDWLASLFNLNFNPIKAYYYTEFLEISTATPLILIVDEPWVDNIIFIPNDVEYNKFAYIQKFSSEKLDGANYHMTLLSNIDNLKRVEIYARARNSHINSGREANFYSYDKGQWELLPKEFIGNDSLETHYKILSNQSGAIAMRYDK